MPDPLISRDDLSDYLGQNLTSSDKALIAVDSASDIVRTIAEQTFNLVEDDEITLDGTGTDALLLPERPVTEVTEVTEGDSTLTVDEDYRLNGNGVLIRMPGLIEAPYPTQVQTLTYWTPGRQNVTVTYSHGYAPNDLPRDVRVVALTIAARLFLQTAGVRAETLGAYSVSYASESGALTDLERVVLSKHRMTHS